MYKHILATLAIGLSIGTSQAATVETTNFITTPDHFSGFEDLPQVSNTLTHLEDGILVQQVNGTYIYNGNFWSNEGHGFWYSGGGDNGYTDIKLASGAQIGNISFLVGNGWSIPINHVHYELLNAGVVVQSGNIDTPIGSWLGFSQGGFNEVRVAVGFDTAPNFGEFEAIAVDSIKVANAVPEPESYLMLLAGLGMLGVAARRARTRVK